MRIVLAVAATVAALATAGPATAAGAARAVGYVPHRCYVSDLAGRFHGAQAGLGNRGFLLTLTNVSGASCRLDGYPGLELRDASWRPLPVTRLRVRAACAGGW
jgi:Protein of unknown function (DUF4232)